MARRLFAQRPSDVGIKVISLDEIRAAMSESADTPDQFPGKFAEFVGEILGEREPVVVPEAVGDERPEDERPHSHAERPDEPENG